MPAKTRNNIIIFWLVIFVNICFIYFFADKLGLRDLIGNILLRDTDDAMRMLSARELLSGKNWFNMLEERINPPHGIIMHWSRLVDLPIASLIWFFSLFLDDETAEYVVAIIWPLLLMIPILYGLCRLTYHFVGEKAIFPTLILSSLSILVYEFMPGRIDHHNIQLILVLFICLGLVELNNRKYVAIYIGILSAISLAIGLETILFIALAVDPIHNKLI